MGLSFQVQRAHSKRKRLPGAGSGASPQHHQATCFHVGRGVPSQSVVKKILKVWVQNQKQNQRCRRPTPDPRTAWSMEKSRTTKKQNRTSLRTKGGRRHQGQEFQSRQNPQEHQWYGVVSSAAPSSSGQVATNAPATDHSCSPAGMTAYSWTPIRSRTNIKKAPTPPYCLNPSPRMSPPAKYHRINWYCGQGGSNSTWSDHSCFYWGLRLPRIRVKVQLELPAGVREAETGQVANLREPVDGPSYRKISAWASIPPREARPAGTTPTSTGRALTLVKYRTANHYYKPPHLPRHRTVDATRRPIRTRILSLNCR